MLVVLGLATGIATASTAGTARVGSSIDPALVKKLKDNARGSVSISLKKSTSFAGFVRAGRNGDLIPAERSKNPDVKARSFLREYGALFGIQNPVTELVATGKGGARGSTRLTYEQVYKGVPVFGGTLRVHIDAANDLTAMNGIFVPGLDVDTNAKISAAEAGARAIASVVADPPTNADGTPASTDGLRAASAKLYVYRTGLIRDASGTNQLVYRVEVTNGGSVREVLFVNAYVGKVVNRYSLVHDALFRELYEQNLGNLIWDEPDPFPGALNADQQNIVRFSGQSYYHFLNAFGRDSYDGAGAKMRSINNDPTIACPNANWNGVTTNYCNGVTADDVVAHEWGHAYTQFTHNLIYQWQPGALNESYSDIWGDVVDQINGFGTDSPNTVRTVGACTTHTTPIPELVINDPPLGVCAAGGAAFGPPLTAAGTTGDLVLVNDGAGASTSDACETPFTNAGALAGKIALLDRGTCAFTLKVKNAQLNGAIAVVVADNVAGPVAGMAGVDPTITIPSLRITLAHGNLLKGALPGGPVNVTLHVKGSGTPEDSYRWLVGEDATAFGGAIRDMWNPNCAQDPGKVTDAEYHCATADGGGVHTNSGVPNHGFALLVDGGTYNGQTVGAIGMTKAAHLYWRAQSVYQTLTSDFNDHADALEASCTDLIGVTLDALGTGTSDPGSSGQAITAADCVEVSDMIAAVELRTDPTEQCNFTPLLQPNPPALCSNQKNPPTHYHEDFENGLGGWTLTNTGVFSGWPGTNWVQDTSLPGGRSGSAAFAADTDGGDCGGGAGDISGVMRMESPSIHLPNAQILSPRLTFEHYIASELGWDGGNLKISVNGGPYELVPASAFSFNPYNLTLNTAAAGNTNPLAGQPAFSGTDGGQVTGSWGESQIDLTKMGIEPGDRIRLRFDFGADGCTGVDGWYVDDIKLRSCNTKRNAVVARKD
jgi:Zn-dependent metalloprotease